MFRKIKSIAFAIKRYGIKSCFFNYLSILISDVCVISFQKSGRTWLRVMLAKVFSQKYGAKLRLDTQLMTLFKPDPNVFFSHAGSTRNNDKINYGNLFRNKRIIFLVRDPRDDVVSLFHDHIKRNFFYEKGDISAFIRDSEWGLKKIIKFMNFWAEEMDKRKEDFMLLRYEDMKENTFKELKRVLDFLKIEIDNDIIIEAINYGSFENMRKMELGGVFKDKRMQPGNIKDSDSYRTRKGKVGSYKEELNKKDVTYINKELKDKLNPVFGYKQRLYYGF